MIRQSNMDHTTPAQNCSHSAIDFRRVQGPQRDTARQPAAAIADTPVTRARRIRQHGDIDLPLYRASLDANFSAIRKLCPYVSLRRAKVMIATARAFARITTGWDDGAFYTVTFDQTLGVWRRNLLFSGPVPVSRCAVCGRPAVYRLRDTPFCRMHSPDHLDHRTDSLFSIPSSAITATPRRQPHGISPSITEEAP